MSSPPRRRHKSAPMEEIKGSVRTKRQRLPELDAPPAANKGSRASSTETEDQTYGEDDTDQGAMKTRQGLPELGKLPEDMLQHIYSLVPLQDAARAACVSRQFLHSWRCYSNLALNRTTLGLTRDNSDESEIRYINKIEKILNNYSDKGMKVNTLKIDLIHCKSVSASYLDRWLQITVKSGINELSLLLSSFMMDKYCFPCSVLLDETTAYSIQSFCLMGCTFRPIETLCFFRRLKSLDLVFVNITEEGLWQFLSRSSNLERLQIYACREIICLKIPCTLEKLKFLIVKICQKLHAVEINAPNLFSFHYSGFPLEISIRDLSLLKDAHLSSFDPSGIPSYGHANLPSIAHNVERLTLSSRGLNVNTTMCLKLLHLKSMEIKLYRSGCSPMYDIFSVVSFLAASPALESFILRVERNAIIHDRVVGEDAYLMGESAYRHDRLTRVKITNFHSARSLIKLVIHILERAPSLEALTLDTTHGYGRKPGDTSKCTASSERGKCFSMSKTDIQEANSTVEAVGRYIAERVPSAVEFKVLEPCRRCYAGNRPI